MTVAAPISKHSPNGSSDVATHTVQGGDPVLNLMSFGVFPECYPTGETDPVLNLKSFGTFPEAYDY